MEKKAIISVQSLSKKYGDFEAVKKISFDVYEGEIFGLLGPNGAGKSTTLEIIETLRQKTSGKVTVDGIDLDTDPNEIKKRIGVQLQTSGYYPNLNLTELLVLFGGLYNREIKPTDFLAKIVSVQVQNLFSYPSILPGLFLRCVFLPELKGLLE